MLYYKGWEGVFCEYGSAFGVFDADDIVQDDMVQDYITNYVAEVFNEKSEECNVDLREIGVTAPGFGWNFIFAD